MQDKQNAYDKLIRQKLAELPDPKFTEAGWQQLTDRLPDSLFDEHLRDALQNLPPTQPTGWDDLRHKIDQQISPDIKIAQSLDQLQPDQVKGWDQLEKRLDETLANDVDTIIANQLPDYTAGPATGWTALASRLEIIDCRKNIIAAWKIIEFSMLMSLLLLLHQYNQEFKINPSPQRMSSEHPHEIAAVKASDDGSPLTDIKDTQAPATLLNTDNRILAEELSESGDKTESSPSANLLSSIDTIHRVSSLNPLSLPSVEIRDDKMSGTEEIASNEVILPSSVYVPWRGVRPPRKKAAPVYSYINAFISPVDINQVITPAQIIRGYDIAAENRLTAGYSAGLLIDVDQGKNGLQTGVIYSHRSYVPTALKWFLEDDTPSDNIPEGYSRFVFNSITFPLNYQRQIWEKNSWLIRGKVGIGMSVVARSTFRTREGQERFVKSFEEFSNQHNQQGGGRTNHIGSTSNGYTNPEAGWFQGGSLLTNSSFYVNGGFSVERSVSNRFSLYVSPQLSRVIYLRDKEGAGPHSDRIHSASVRLGTRYLFSH